MTQAVHDCILYYLHHGITYEIHLIDSPGFDDGTVTDARVLSRIAEYVNINYKLKKRLAGVLYLRDITKDKVGESGQRNLRILENMIGQEKWDNCILVTTKWGSPLIPKTKKTGKRHYESIVLKAIRKA